MLKKWCLRLIISLLIACLLAILGVAAWVWQPYDKTAWRVKLPVGSGIQVRVLPMLMLATSPAGRWLLDKKGFSLHHGDVRLNDADGLRVHCQHCWLEAKSVSDKPLMLDSVALWLKLDGQQLNGYLLVDAAKQPFKIDFEGKATMRSLKLNWTLPATPLASLLSPLRGHSEAISQATVSGSLSATGILRWPRQSWSVQPQLAQLHVSGLDLSKVTASSVQYDCPLLDEQKHPEKVHWLNYDKMGRWLPMATIIAEDAEFRHHPGYALTQMQQLLGKESTDKAVGGSTITQQVVKYMFTNGERTWKRKIEELLYAVQLENTLDKTNILNLYLNTVDWGPSLCGAHAAANYYFGLSPAQMNPIQAAWLAGIIKNPHRAWKQQFMAKKPELARAESILRYMPESARKQPGSLNFRASAAK
ncbi:MULTISPECIES: biosynthetic peptidoglycan transglycosylase [unclassified Methylophilus]|uniref:biosynthetic peptidoglycan transglycosylase n=1 Tax=unclassified Methylophilus TaxID=2630143 RepID=UPI00036CC74F|nr:MULTISPECIES: biosynthetic peptidoglycan transglycosylase [unclassified Methylophilus]